MRKKNKNKNYIYILIVLIATITIFIDKIKADNINNLVEEVSNTNEITNQLEKAETFENKEIKEGENLVIHYLDVGQADSILIQNNGKNMLIDAGTNDKGKEVVDSLKKYGVEKVDYLVGTHPHEDHIGGLDNVIDNFEIGEIYMPKVKNNTKTFEDVLDAVSRKNLKITSPNVGYKFNLGNAICEIMNCGTGTSEEMNNLNLSSIVIRMSYGEQSFLFMADAENENEEARKWTKTNVLKVGHHGSNTSSTQKFLDQVKPEIAIISTGIGNKYGHPKKVTLDKLERMNTKIYRTDENGTITLICDGKENKISVGK